MATKKKKNVKLVPKLRFQQFSKDEEWELVPLRKHAAIIKKKAGEQKHPVMSVQSGVGLISQLEKFGRDISGKSYKNYTVIEEGDFAYNKSATKQFPEGFIAKHQGKDSVAVPNSIFTCFSIKSKNLNGDYLFFQLLDNLHGRWLKKFITIGARANGALSINNEDLLSLPIPIPTGKQSAAEQQKIADCLSSLDKLIAAHSTKLDALQDHKKGLLQKLFPAKGETTPELRFSEFTEGGGWKQSTIGQTFKTQSGGTPSRNKQSYWNGDIPWVTTSLVNFNVITKVIEYISADGLENSSAKIFPQSTILLAMYGQGKTRGQVAILGIEAATNQACAAILPSSKVGYQFTFQNLSGRYEELRKLSNEGGQQNLSQTLVKDLSFSYPTGDEEQQKLANCLSSLDSLITAQIDKTAYLKEHKKGLMQQLFPNSEEVVT